MSGISGVIVAFLSLLIAWFQFQGISTNPNVSQTTIRIPDGEIFVANALLVIAFFLSITISSALVIRIISRKHEFAAFFISVVLASVTNFLTILVIYLTPPRSLNSELFNSANELVLYASIFIYLVFCGKAVLKDFLSLSEKTDEEDNTRSKSDESSYVWGSLIIVIILFFAWKSCILKGQELLSETFLPKVAHPVHEVKSKTDA